MCSVSVLALLSAFFLHTHLSRMLILTHTHMLTLSHPHTVLRLRLDLMPSELRCEVADRAGTSAGASTSYGPAAPPSKQAPVTDLPASNILQAANIQSRGGQQKGECICASQNRRKELDKEADR